MSTDSGHFEWFDSEEAEERFVRTLQPSEVLDDAEITLINSLDVIDRDDMAAGKLKEPLRYVSRYLDETRDHLDRLSVSGVTVFDEDDLRMLGPSLAREATYREDAVFHILNRRRNELPSYIKRIVGVSKNHMMQYGLASQAGRISLDNISNEATTQAQKLLGPLVADEEFEDSFMASDLQRRVLRAVYYILTEPTESSELLVARFTRQASKPDRLKAEELIARTYNFVNSQQDKHKRNIDKDLENEEKIVLMLEGKRLERLMELGRTVLVAGLGIITADEYKDDD